MDFIKNDKTAVNERYDYVPTLGEVRALKEQMIFETDKLREERKMNEFLVPEKDTVSTDLALVKD